MSAAKEAARARRGPDARARLDAISADLDAGGVPCSPEAVVAGAKGAAAMGAAASSAALAVSLVFLDRPSQLSALLLCAALPALCYLYFVSYPSSAARRRASEVMRGAADAVNLMVMGVRQDASLPRSIMFASGGGSAFAAELRRCMWEVVTGTHTGFEEALHALGGRWERFSSELKTSLNAIVVASKEATDEGKRRALERANRAMVAGAKRRVEEYALSLSTPSMLLFALGILLPIMVGSFMPMLSWDIWSGAAPDRGPTAGGGMAFETAVVMDLMFPAVALLVAMDAVSRRPVDGPRDASGRGVGGWAAAIALGAACSASAYWLLGPGDHAPLVLLAGTLPASAVLVASGRRRGARAASVDDEVQDLLFRAGARMLEGDNFESALDEASEGAAGRPLGRRLCLRAFVMGQGLDRAVDSEARGARSNPSEALKVVARASAKDEAGAGMLAMDIASYLRELSEIEAALKMRLRPTISMMRMTAHFLGPLVLGVTFGVFVSLASVAGGDGSAAAGAMLLTLGLFLAEMNAAVCYFVWGIEGGGDRRDLERSTGACVMVSQGVFVSTALFAA
ncbi:MAG: hypothetical protein AB1793_04020 [Candidatus Thermoplasmatota archaeon]